MAEAPTNLVLLRSTRDRVIEILGARYADDTLDVDEYERRVHQAHEASSLAELEVLVADLDAPEQASRALVRRRPQSFQVIEDVPESKVVVAMFGGVERRGAWVVPRKLRAFAMMGGADLDFREARFGPGVTHVTIFAMMGGAEILVPPGLRVEVDGIGILGGFGDDTEAPDTDDPDAPVLRVTGLAFMGGVDVSQRLPGESKRQARKRRRDERKQLDEARRKQLESGS